MSGKKKLVVNLSEVLYNEFNEALRKDCRKKSEFITEAIILYIEEQKKESFIEQMKKGYNDMARLNLEISECGLEDYINELNEYEAKLSESDLPDDYYTSKKRRYILC
ncbi:antitoxin endoAI [Clostridium tepidiprofundi DSM 19306]|uniref:Antitoxin endoAI n=1 Tax=Clostridium tepidiprofundi DSM 19306 TaxID=1121338 RepID=A0A151B6J8_9CLOT|nr:CopG family transcriptional regulator [Clostridium tepidiprofundi]KYH35423.1 antitoxin endoAI [Clostridium tepidiprofundi DSM 19306]